ncbi:MAG: hypothetical protein AAF447_24935 [Myxococcota bacterium]
MTLARTSAALPASIAFVTAFLGGWSLSCERGGCVDLDGDGFFVGSGCGEEPGDCDDANALRNRDCERFPPPDCAVAPTSTGCPCSGALGRSCFPAPATAMGFGACRSGFAACTPSGTFGICEGAILPQPEGCNERDDDCDGFVDEGSESPCGGCTPGCRGPVLGGNDAPFTLAGEPGLALTPDGDLTLRRELQITRTLWLANSAGGTLSRIDTDAAAEVGRYALAPAGAAVPPEPSRVAVDYLGDAWVANRAFGGQSTLLRIASDSARCVDRDEDGMLTTSTGPVPLPYGDDECVTLHVPVGAPGEVARALAIDGNLGLEGAGPGDVWVGLHDGEAIEHRSGVDGSLLARVETPGFRPYAAVFDGPGTLWMISRDGQLLSLDRRARPLEPVIQEAPLPCFLFYGLDVDASGALLITGFDCDQVHRYEPLTGRWMSAATEVPSPRGAAVADGSRDPVLAWVAHTDGRASRLRRLTNPARWTTDASFELASARFRPLQVIGAAVDAAGRPWFVAETGVLAGDPLTGVATRLDPESGAVTAQVPVGLAPHSQGDMTGAKRAGGFDPEGVYRHVFTEGCGGADDAETEWLRLHLQALPGAGGTVEVRLRQAGSVDALGDASFALLGAFPEPRGPYELAPLDLTPGGVIEVELTLRTRFTDGAPRIRRVGLEVRCPGPI